MIDYELYYKRERKKKGKKRRSIILDNIDPVNGQNQHCNWANNGGGHQ